MWPLFLSGVLAIWLSLGIWRQRDHILNRTFSLLMAAAAIWALCYMMSVLAADPPTQVLWEKAKYIGIVAIGPLWLAFALQYVQQGHWLKKWWLRALIALEIGGVPAVFTNDQHRLWWPTTTFVTNGPYPDLAVTYGPIFWLHTAISYSFLLAGVLIYLNFYRQVPLQHRRQTQIIILAMSIPLVGNILVLSDSLPAAVGSIDLTPFLISLTGVLVAYTMFKYRFLDVRPVARMIIFDQMKGGIIILDEQQRIVDINPAAQEMTGMELEQVMGIPLAKSMHNEALASALHQILAGELGVVEIELDNGAYSRIVEISISDLCDERTRDQKKGHILSLYDISDHKQVQHLTTQMMRMTAHDLRTPLSLAVGYLSLVAEEEFPAATRANLEIVSDALDRIELLINDLLDLERVRSGVGMLVEEIDPVELVRQVHRELQPLAIARRQDFSLNISGTPPLFRGDDRLLQQALNNLIANSIKYTPEEGTICLSVRAESDKLVFSVIDSGYGISEEMQAHLFEPFYRVPETKNIQSGSGLGLSLVKAIVEAHGGQIWVESALGKGSRCEFSLPLGNCKPVGL